MSLSFSKRLVGWVLAGTLMSSLMATEVLAQTRSAASESAIFQQTNAYRSSQRLPALRPNPQLARAAQQHAYNMARLETLSHTLYGKGMADRVAAQGYRHSYIAENVAYNYGQHDPAGQAMAGWKRSWGHNRNMLSNQVTEMGVGAYRSRSGKWYFCQVFGKPRPGPGGGSEVAQKWVKITNPTGTPIHYSLSRGGRFQNFTVRARGWYKHSACASSPGFTVSFRYTVPDAYGRRRNVTTRKTLSPNRSYTFQWRGSVLVLQ